MAVVASVLALAGLHAVGLVVISAAVPRAAVFAAERVVGLAVESVAVFLLLLLPVLSRLRSLLLCVANSYNLLLLLHVHMLIALIRLRFPFRTLRASFR